MKPTGIQLISQEREEQIQKHNRTVEGDKQQNTDFQLIDAAGALMMDYPGGFDPVSIHGDNPPIGWNSDTWKHMLGKDYRDRLVIAGALIAAEVDRITE